MHALGVALKRRGRIQDQVRETGMTDDLKRVGSRQRWRQLGRRRVRAK
jgi:hypothetical protein